MRYKKYPKYKDSGIEWIGEIPEGWKVLKMAWLFNQISSGATPPSSRSEYYNGGIPWVNTADLNNGYISDTPNKISRLALKKHSALKLYPPNTLLIAMYGATIGKVGITKIAAATNQACCALAEPRFVNNRYIFYWLISNRANIVSLAYGGGQPNISQALIRSLRLPLPCIREQLQITDYLNHKTSQIDSLISDKQKLIELLEEKRSALITQAVTKGLDPDVPMKDSGIEWIGEIPEGWGIHKLRHLFTFYGGLSITRSDLREYGVDCINYGEIHSKYTFDLDLSKDTLPKIDSMLTAQKPDALIQKGDFVFCDTSEDLAGCGNCVFIRDHDNRRVFAGSHTIIAKPKKEFDSVYMGYLLKSKCTRSQFQRKVAGVKVYSITQRILKEISLFVPSLIEQKSIANFLDHKTSQIDSLISDIEKSIALLEEYRESLITAAVTGKIDVRQERSEQVAQ